MRVLDKIAGFLLVLIGLLHLGVGHMAFLEPTERGVWFVSAGFLLITTGLANIAASRASTRSQIVAAASGNLAILVLGALIAIADPNLLLAPQTLLLVGLGVLLIGLRIRDLLALRR